MGEVLVIGAPRDRARCSSHTDVVDARGEFSVETRVASATRADIVPVVVHVKDGGAAGAAVESQPRVGALILCHRVVLVEHGIAGVGLEDHARPLIARAILDDEPEPIQVVLVVKEVHDLTGQPGAF
ncbi:MAG: hypothetical protein E4H15_07755 [Syntrophobacterales bacterium]|nr:MAG: hypothetical protein E4H15_07755 [Syntrophobacterales bacterium]